MYNHMEGIHGIANLSYVSPLGLYTRQSSTRSWHVEIWGTNGATSGRVETNTELNVSLRMQR